MFSSSHTKTIIYRGLIKVLATLFCYISLFINSAFPSSINLDERFKSAQILDQIEFISADRQETIFDVMTHSQWQAEQPTRTLADDQALWGRISVSAQGDLGIRPALVLNSPSLEVVDFYVVDQANQLIKEGHNGDLLERDSHGVNLSRYWIWSVFPQDGKLTIYFRIDDPGYLSFGVELWDFTFLQMNEENRVAFVGVLIGAFALLSLYFLITYVAFRRKIRFWFAAMSLLFLLMFSNFEGILKNNLITYFSLFDLTSILTAGLIFCSSRVSHKFTISVPKAWKRVPIFAAGVLLLNGIFLSGYWQTVILLSTIWVACMSLFVQSSQFSNHYIKMPNRIYRIGWALIFIASGWVAQSYVLGQLVSKSTILLSYFLILLGVIALSLAVEVYEKVLTSTERKRQSNAISDLKRFYNIFRNSAEGLYTSNLEGKLISLNPAMSKLFGYDSEQDMLDNLPETKCLYANQEDRLRLISQVVNNGQAMDMEFEGLKKDGTRFWFSISVQFIEEEGQKVFTGSIIDVTDRRKFQHNLEYLANHDSLTGLNNRRAFEKHMSNSLNAAIANDAPVTLLYLDLDQFKVVNDTCGHKAGDILLARLTQKLKTVVADKGLLARLGGDEFGVLFEGAQTKLTLEIANQLLDTVKSFKFVWDQRLFTIGVSIGMVEFDKNINSLEHMLSMADAACYMSKEQGRNQIHVYSDQDEDIQRYENEIGWVSKIKSAIDDDKFELYYQHYLDLGGTNSGFHYEVLLRLIDDKGKAISPAIFLPSAERFDLAGRIDQWVVRNTFKWLSENRDHLHRLTHCNINLSGQTVADKDAKNFILACFAQYNIPFHKICFEVTESMAIVKIDEAVDFIQELRQKGCLFALDDFGSGFSSYSYLKQLPVDFLKIDGSFVKDILTDKIDSALVTSINDVAKAIGMHTVAEFVESTETISHLNAIGINYAQGFAIARPRPLKEFEPLASQEVDVELPADGILPV